MNKELASCSMCGVKGFTLYSIREGHSTKAPSQHRCSDCIPKYQFKSGQGVEDKYE